MSHSKAADCCVYAPLQSAQSRQPHALSKYVHAYCIQKDDIPLQSAQSWHVDAFRNVCVPPQSAWRLRLGTFRNVLAPVALTRIVSFLIVMQLIAVCVRISAVSTEQAAACI